MRPVATHPATTEQIRRLRPEAERGGPLTETAVTLPRGAATYAILRPTDTDLLLDRAAGDPEQNLPYWAEIWPSGIALAAAINRQPDLVRGRTVLELGCGLGITAIAALRAGATLTAADYAPESLLLCRYNTLRNAGHEPATLQLNWRTPDPSLFALAGPGFPVVLAADILYEARDVAPLLALVPRLVAPGGLLWLAEPGRPPAQRFLAAIAQMGWCGATEEHAGPWPDPNDAGVVVHVHRLQRP